MPRSTFFFILIIVLLTGCAAPDQQDTQTTPLVTEPAAPTTGEMPVSTPTSPPESPTPQVEQPTATPEPTLPPTGEPVQPSTWIAYIGADGNLWLVNPDTGEQRQSTQDAVPSQPGQETETIRYCCARWSSDGQLLAFQREAGTPITSGYEYQFDVWVFDMGSGEARPVFENQQVIGYAWKPGTHLLTYGLPIANEYFMARGEPAAEFAGGIWAVDVDEGNPYELVPPERGFTLIGPKWSNDGRFMAFEEILYMEGRGQFAYYDFEAQQYVAWDDIIGSYDWSPDSEQIAYDRLAYTPTGEERIWLNSREGNDEQAFSPEFDPGYAFNPVFSPQGDQLAYLAELTSSEVSNEYTLFVQPVQNGEPRDLGVFEQVYNPVWSPDGERLALASGPFENRQILVVTVSDGTVEVLAEGSEPAWQTVSP